MGKNKTFKQKMTQARKRYHENKAYIKYPDLDREPTMDPAKLVRLLRALDAKAQKEENKIRARGYCPIHHLGLTIHGKCPLECGYQRGEITQ